MDLVTFQTLYWNYYCQLESDFFALEPYCAIDEDNDEAFSNKYLQLFLSICGEFDTVCKQLCKAIDPSVNTDRMNIKNYHDIFHANIPVIMDEEVSLNQHSYRLIKPFEGWTQEAKPQWWQDYNQVKHHRDSTWNEKSTYKWANQKNIIDALSALYILEEYWAAFNFIIDQDKKNSYEMLCCKSSKISITEWSHYYTAFIGNFFNVKECKEHINYKKQEEDKS